MNYVSIIRTGSTQKLEDKINETLIENKGNELIDIKYSSSYNDHTVVHTAIIIFKKVVF